MFYSHFVYVRQGPLAKVWLAAHVLRQLKKAEITSLDITANAGLLMGTNTSGGKAPPMALRLCGQLLYGLVRIYQKKVDLASAEAQDVLRKLESMLPEDIKASSARVAPDTPSARAGGRRSMGAENARIELDPSELRAHDRAITLHDRALDAGADDLFANLGAGLDANMSLEEQLALEGGMLGEEFMGDESILGDAHMELNLDSASGVFRLTQSGIDTTQRSGKKGDKSLREAEENRSSSLNAAHHMEDELDMALEEGDALQLDDLGEAEGGRAVAADESLLSTGANNKKDLTGLQLDDDMEIPATGMDEADFNLGLPGDKDSRQGSLAAGEEEDLETLEKREKELEASLANIALEKKKERAQKLKALQARKRQYHPVVDTHTEIPGAVLKQWLEDASDIVVKRGVVHQPLSASQKFTPEEEELENTQQMAMGSHSAIPHSLFSLPSVGLGSRTYAPLNALTRELLRRTDVGVWNPKVLSFLQQNRLTLEPQLAGLSYEKLDESIVAKAHAEALAHDISITSGGAAANLSGIGMEELDFGAAGGAEGIEATAAGDEDPFAHEHELDQGMGGAADFDNMEGGGEIPPAEEEEKMEDEEAAAAEEEERRAEEEFDLAMAVGEGGDDSLAIEARIARDVRDWWGERDASLNESGLLKESVESGWSKRTKKMHQVLAKEWSKLSAAQLKKSGGALSFEALVDGHSKAVAAGSFYQLLVLASGGFLRVNQGAVNGDITLKKSETFDSKKLPKVPGGTGSANDSSLSASAPESQQY